jgi:hypothetical protein
MFSGIASGSINHRIRLARQLHPGAMRRPGSHRVTFVSGAAMTEPNSFPSYQPTSLQVLVRFAMRLAILSAFATFSTKGFATAMSGLLGLATAYCMVVGGVRREKPLGPMLTHFDEAVGYALAYALVFRLF